MLSKIKQAIYINSVHLPTNSYCIFFIFIFLLLMLTSNAELPGERTA